MSTPGRVAAAFATANGDPDKIPNTRKNSRPLLLCLSERQWRGISFTVMAVATVRLEMIHWNITTSFTTTTLKSWRQMAYFKSQLRAGQRAKLCVLAALENKPSLMSLLAFDLLPQHLKAMEGPIASTGEESHR